MDIFDNDNVKYTYAYFKSIFFFDIVVDGVVTKTAEDNLTSFVGSGYYIKRSDSHIYQVATKDGGNSIDYYELFPTIRGNHPSKYLYYSHIRFDPVVVDSNGVHVGSALYYQIFYYDCLDNAINAKYEESNFVQSIWTPTHIYQPADLVPFKKYFYPVYNLPYPIVRAGKYDNIYNQVDVDEIVFYYDAPTATDKFDFSNIDSKSLDQLFTSFGSIPNSCTRPTPSTDPLKYVNSDILINLSALKDPDHCQNLNTNSAALASSNSFLCSNKPDSKYLDKTYLNTPNIIEQVLVIEPCSLNGSSLYLLGGIKKIDNVFYRVRPKNPTSA